MLILTGLVVIIFLLQCSRIVQVYNGTEEEKTLDEKISAFYTEDDAADEVGMILAHIEPHDIHFMRF